MLSEEQEEEDSLRNSMNSSRKDKETATNGSTRAKNSSLPKATVVLGSTGNSSKRKVLSKAAIKTSSAQNTEISTEKEETAANIKQRILTVTVICLKDQVVPLGKRQQLLLEMKSIGSNGSPVLGSKPPKTPSMGNSAILMKPEEQRKPKTKTGNHMKTPEAAKTTPLEDLAVHIHIVSGARSRLPKLPKLLLKEEKTTKPLALLLLVSKISLPKKRKVTKKKTNLLKKTLNSMKKEMNSLSRNQRRKNGEAAKEHHQNLHFKLE